MLLKAYLFVIWTDSLLFAFSLTPDSDISDLITFFTNQNIMVTMFNDSDYVSAAPHSAALNVMHSEKVRVRYMKEYPLEGYERLRYFL